MVIIALITSGALVALRIQSQRTHLQETQEMLHEAREALYAYAAVVGQLPCPADNADSGAALPSCNGTVVRGSLPWKTLALGKTDPWGNTLQYAVTGQMTSSTNIKLSTQGYVVLTNTNGSLNSSGTVAFAVWSRGEDALDGSSAAAADTVNVPPIVMPDGTPNDDEVVWASRYVLFGRMIEAGRNIPLN